jgi:hypothetical protein
MRKKDQVFAIIREDKDVLDVQQKVTVVKVVVDQDVADSEVQRLNEVNKDKACEYWWQATRIDVQE